MVLAHNPFKSIFMILKAKKSPYKPSRETNCKNSPLARWHIKVHKKDFYFLSTRNRRKFHMVSQVHNIVSQHDATGL